MNEKDTVHGELQVHMEEVHSIHYTVYSVQYTLYTIHSEQHVKEEYSILSYQLILIKMRAKLANLNDCTVRFLSRATVHLCRYCYTVYSIHYTR